MRPLGPGKEASAAGAANRNAVEANAVRIARRRQDSMDMAAPYLCRDPASSAGSGVVRFELLVRLGGACARSVVRRVMCARAPSLTSVRDPRVGSGVGDMMFDG